MKTDFIDKKIPEFVETTVNRLVGVRNEDDFFNEVRGDYLIQLTNYQLPFQHKQTIHVQLYVL